MPVQAEIDMTPLYSEEFDEMPKACCSRCNVEMSPALLEIHVASCGIGGLPYSGESVTVASAEEGGHNDGSLEVSDCSLVFAKPQC